VIGKGVRLYVVPGIFAGHDVLCFGSESPDEHRVKMKLLRLEAWEQAGYCKCIAGRGDELRGALRGDQVGERAR